jgi:hypothetical protein
MGFIDNIRAKVQAEFTKIDQEGFENAEARLARKQGKEPDQMLSREDVVEIVKDAGVSNKFINRVADGIMDRLDRNGGGITAQEWNNRAKK